MPGLAKDLWSLIWGRPEVDPNDLAVAVQEQAARPQLDYRTRMLIHDSVDALKSYWGPERVHHWLARSPARDRIETICLEEFDKVGFPLLRESLVEKTDPQTLESLFRELGSHVHRPVRLAVGGSIALILPGYIARATSDIDVVDEVPAELRSQHELLNGLQKRYRLFLTHFGSHYLPTGWANRLHYFNEYGDLRVYLVDVYDIFLGKLFSKRAKDLDDLRMLAPQLDKATLLQKLKDTTAALQKDPLLLPLAQASWYIVFGEAFPQ
jgi:hypothetical protein